MIWLKMLKKWGECPEGSVVQFNEGKGRRVIAAGFAVEVPEPKVRQAPCIERAVIVPPAETAVAAPQVTPAAPPVVPAESNPEPKPNRNRRKEQEPKTE